MQKVEDWVHLKTDPIRNLQSRDCDETALATLALGDGHDARPPDARAANQRAATIIDTARATNKAKHRDARRRRREGRLLE